MPLYLRYAFTTFFVVTLFFIDLMFLHIFEEQMLNTVVIFYFHAIFLTQSLFAPIIALLFIALESMVMHGRFGSQLVLLLPLTAIGLRLKRVAPSTPILYRLVLVLALILNYWVLGPLLLHTPLPSIRYTTLKIAANLALSLIF